MISRKLKEATRRLLPARPKAQIILSGPLRGSYIQTSWHDYPAAILGTTERPLLDWFRRHVQRGETWLDVGAHCGYTAIALSRCVGRDGRVVAFEPVVSTAGRLARTRELNQLDQLTVIPLALVASPDFQLMRIPAIRGMADSTITDACHSECVLGIALDSIWPGIGGANQIHGIKIDVQGLEFQALLGMREHLERWGPKLVIEFHRGVDRGDILDLLLSCGYSPQFGPVGRTATEPPLDDVSYVFLPEARTCAYSSTRSTIARS